MRIIACFFVIFNHTGNNGFFLFSQRELGGVSFWCYLFVSIFCKFSVPLFLAISGALLIPKMNESITTIWKRRILRIASTLIVFSFIFYIEDVYTGNQMFDIKLFWMRLYGFDWNYAYWYLYAYIAFLISLPFLRTLAYHLSDRYYYYMFTLVVFFNGFLPIMEYILWKGNHSLNNHLSVNWLATNIVFYPVTGYFLQHRIKDIEKKGKYIYGMWMANIITIIVCCYMTYMKVKITGECFEGTSQSFHNSFVMINTVTIFITIKYLFTKYQSQIPKWFEKAIFSVGGCTFGIYLWHIMLIENKVFNEIWNILRINLRINHLTTAFLVCFVVMLICYMVTWIMKKIPFIRTLVL